MFEALNSSPAEKAAPPPDEKALCLAPADVRRTLSRVKIHKASGPDNIPGRVLRECADQLAPVLTYIFNISLKPSQSSIMLQDCNHHSSAKKKQTNYITQWLSACCTHPHHDEVLWEAGEGAHRLQTQPYVWPIPVCLPAKSFHRGRNLLRAPPEPRTPGGEEHSPKRCSVC